MFPFLLWQIIESEVLEILMVFSKDEDPEMSMIRACAERALETAEGLNLIKQNKESSWRWRYINSNYIFQPLALRVFYIIFEGSWPC